MSWSVIDKYTPPKTISKMNKDELVYLLKESCAEFLQKSQKIDIEDALKHIKYDVEWHAECQSNKDTCTVSISVKPEIKNIRWEE